MICIASESGKLYQQPSHINACGSKQGCRSAGLTEDGVVLAVGAAIDGIHAPQEGARVVLVQLDRAAVGKEVVALRGAAGPVGVAAPAAQDTQG